MYSNLHIHRKERNRMLKLNKYLRELGIDENFYLFDEKMKQLDCRYKEDENGFVPAECWNLDTTFAMYIYSHLCYFRDNCNYGHPGNLSEEQWNNILNKMIEGFRLLITRNEDDIPSKTKEKKIKYGIRLFAKYFSALWY